MCATFQSNNQRGPLVASRGSISRLVRQLKTGDEAAARALWDRYCDRLVRLARGKLRWQTARRVADEEDVALSAFNSLCLGAREGRFPALAERNALWGLLVFITAQKAADVIRYENRRKPKSPPHAATAGYKPAAIVALPDDVLAREPGPATLNIWAEEYERLLARLGDERLRHIAELNVQGYKIDEIADRLNLARRTIHRKLDIIRKTWEEELPP
jgi:DNA-directed RNA polymerase specialized sigma24 family protein